MVCSHGTTITNPSTCGACKEEVREIATLLAQEKFGEAIVAMNGGGRAARFAAAGSAGPQTFTLADFRKAAEAGVSQDVLDEIADNLITPDGWNIKRDAAQVRTAYDVEHPPNGWARR